MPARTSAIHLAELLGKVRRYSLDQERELDAQAESRAPELLRSSGKLTPEYSRLLDHARAAGVSVDAMRHDLSYLEGVDDAQLELIETMAKKMFSALGGSSPTVNATDCRKWGRKKWAKFFGCSEFAILDPAKVVNSFDLSQIANQLALFRVQASSQIRAERLEKMGADFFKPTIWEYASQQVLKRATFEISVDELGESVGLMKLNALEKSTPISCFIAELDRSGFTEDLLKQLCELYPKGVEVIGLVDRAVSSESGRRDSGSDEVVPPLPDSKITPDDGSGRSQGEVTEPVRLPSPPADVDYVFRLCGNMYEISGFGERGYIRCDLKGLRQIQRVIEAAGKPVSMQELVTGGVDERIHADKRSQQPVLDEEAISAIREKRADLQEELENAREMGNVAEQERAQSELEALDAEVGRALSLRGRSRDMNNAWDKLRPSIHASLKRAYEAMRNANPPLSKIAEHFELAICSEGGAFVYRSDRSTIRWKINSPDVAPGATL
jgi:hypothetical protein